MDVKKAAFECEKRFHHMPMFVEEDPKHTGRAHLHTMVSRIMSGEVSGEKAHRWIGWIQACMVFHGAATLEEVKRINKDS